MFMLGLCLCLWLGLALCLCLWLGLELTLTQTNPNPNQPGGRAIRTNQRRESQTYPTKNNIAVSRLAV